MDVRMRHSGTICIVWCVMVTICDARIDLEVLGRVHNSKPPTPLLRLHFDTARSPAVRCWGRYCGRSGREQAKNQLDSPRAHDGDARNAPPMWCDLWATRSDAVNHMDKNTSGLTTFLVSDTTWVEPLAQLHPNAHAASATSTLGGNVPQDRNCLRLWATTAGGHTNGDSVNLPPPTWWRARHPSSKSHSGIDNHKRGGGGGGSGFAQVSSHDAEGDDVFVGGSGWWVCELPTLIPAVPRDLYPRHLELRCGTRINLLAASFAGSGGSGGVPVAVKQAAPHHHVPNEALPCSSQRHPNDLACEVVYGLSKDEGDVIAQVQADDAASSSSRRQRKDKPWGTSATALRGVMAFLFSIAVLFFFSMVYMIASPTYHRKLISIRLAKKFAELEDWVSNKEAVIHDAAEEHQPQQHDDVASVAGGGARRRMQRLNALGFDISDGTRPLTLPQHAAPASPKKQSPAPFSASATLYQNPQRRTLGEMLQSSRTSQQQQQQHQKEQHESTWDTVMSSEDRMYWSGEGAASSATTTTHHNHSQKPRQHKSQQQRRRKSSSDASVTVSPVVAANTVDTFPIDGLL